VPTFEPTDSPIPNQQKYIASYVVAVVGLIRLECQQQRTMMTIVVEVVAEESLSNNIRTHRGRLLVEERFLVE